MAREVVVHVFRHAQATGGNPGARLTPEGRRKFPSAARELLRDIPKNAVVKFYSSPFLRARQTRQGLEAHVRLRRESLPKAREREKLVYRKRLPKGTVAERELWKGTKTVALKRLARAQWAANKTPEEGVADYKRILVDFPQRLSRAKGRGPPIHLVMVTHAGPPALNALLNALAKRKLASRRPIENLERVVLRFGKGRPSWRFRNYSGRVRL
jgi:broad specificity phosphatase PhoE